MRNSLFTGSNDTISTEKNKKKQNHESLTAVNPLFMRELFLMIRLKPPKLSTQCP